MALDTVVKELRRHKGISEFVVRHHLYFRALERAGRGGAESGTASAADTRVRLFVDSREGRGEARFSVNADDRRVIRSRLDAAVELALQNRGPAWRLPPPGAPARVKVTDQVIDGAEPSAARQIAARARKVAGQRASIRVVAGTEEVQVVTSAGFDNVYRATSIELEVVGGGRIGERARHVHRARRLEDLSLRELHFDPRSTERTPPGTYPLAVRSTAVGPHPMHSIFLPLLQLTDAEAYRLGLARARPGDRVAASSLSISSDGAIDHAPLSRPFDEDGAATRRFAIVEDGLVANLSLDVREAGLLGRYPNGGVRNLVVRARPEAESELVRGPLLDVQTFDWLDTDRSTGAITAQIGRADVVDQEGRRRPVSGGIIRAALTELFAEAAGTPQALRHGWYRGPALLRLGRVEVR